uniref:Caprin-1_dimer domain-containing protein n=1 Tax=Strongyloides papillosus TaxID=174720 RepID=A0A0N5CIP3_STREA
MTIPDMYTSLLLKVEKLEKELSEKKEGVQQLWITEQIEENKIREITNKMTMFEISEKFDDFRDVLAKTPQKSVNEEGKEDGLKKYLLELFTSKKNDEMKLVEVFSDQYNPRSVESAWTEASIKIQELTEVLKDKDKVILASMLIYLENVCTDIFGEQSKVKFREKLVKGDFKTIKQAEDFLKAAMIVQLDKENKAICEVNRLKEFDNSTHKK